MTTQLRKTVLDLLLDGVPPKAPAPALATSAPAAKRRAARTAGEVAVDALISKGFEIGFFGNPISFGGTPMAKSLGEIPQFLAYRALTCREADRRRTLP